MANPNRTTFYLSQRKMSCVAEEVFNTKDEAREWLNAQTGDRKVIRSFRVGRKTEHYVASRSVSAEGSYLFYV